MVDGEASAADLVDVRPHLRNCPACSATVRELRRASMPLAAVFPAAGMVLADGPVGQAGGLLGRLAEWVLTSAHERVVGSVMRAQAVLDTVTAGKMAAVAASAAALAGGGAAAMHDATDAATPMPRAAGVKRAPAHQALPSARAARTAVVRTRVPAPLPALRTAASEHAHRPRTGGSAADRVHRRDGRDGRVLADDRERAERRRGHGVRARVPLTPTKAHSVSTAVSRPPCDGQCDVEPLHVKRRPGPDESSRLVAQSSPPCPRAP